MNLRSFINNEILRLDNYISTCLPKTSIELLVKKEVIYGKKFCRPTGIIPPFLSFAKAGINVIVVNLKVKHEVFLPAKTGDEFSVLL